MSGAPCFAEICAQVWATASGEPISQTYPSTTPPLTFSCATALETDWALSAITTVLARNAENFLASASPMPDVPPVMTTSLPAK